MDDDRLTLDLDGWEGPLDLLLSLARAQKVDLREISILALVERYLEVVGDARRLRLEVAADWLVMAAWLAYLKSGLLLPHDPEAEPDPQELAARLHLRLQRLDAMREAGARLMARDRIGRDVFPRGAPEGLRVIRRPAWQANLHDLLSVYAAIATRAVPIVHVVPRRAVMTLDDALRRVEAMLGMAIDWVELAGFLPDGADTSARASSFAATLELARQGRIELRQAAPFAPLYVKAA